MTDPDTRRVLVPLAPGCEEMEAVTIIDVLRRGGAEVTVAGLVEGEITGSRGVRIQPDTTLDAVVADNAEAAAFDMVALPGGLPGADHLASDARIATILHAMQSRDGYIAAVCAAPKVLARHGLLNNKQATAYPGVLEAESHPTITTEAVTRDGHIITARSAGAAMDFALTLVEALFSKEKRDEVEKALVR